MNLQLKPNANQVINTELHRKVNTAIYKSLISAVNNRYETLFARNMQDYVQRIGQIVNKVAVTPKMKTYTYLGAVDYLTSVLGDSNLHSMLRNIEVNAAGNSIKHSGNDVYVNIKECIHQYNRLIDSLVKKLQLRAFKICYVNYNVKNSNKEQKTKFITEKKDIKYDNIKGVKFSIEMAKTINIDQYNKNIETALIVSWPEESDMFLKCYIKNMSTNKILASDEHITMDSSKRYKISLIVPERLFVKRKLSIKVEMKLFEETKHSYETGILLWKKTHSYKEEKELGSKILQMSYIY